MRIEPYYPTYPVLPKNAEEDTNFCFLRAVEEFKERHLKGPGVLTEEEIQEKLAEFKARFKPENGSEEDMARFIKELIRFEELLRSGNKEFANLRLMPYCALQQKLTT